MSPEELTKDKELRYSSRKWALVNKTIWIYTGVHLLNAVVLLAAMYLKWLPAGIVKDIWISSLTIWSAGTLAVIGWYMKMNVNQKGLPNGGRK